MDPEYIKENKYNIHHTRFLSHFRGGTKVLAKPKKYMHLYRKSNFNLHTEKKLIIYEKR